MIGWTGYIKTTVYLKKKKKEQILTLQGNFVPHYKFKMWVSFFYALYSERHEEMTIDSMHARIFSTLFVSI